MRVAVFGMGHCLSNIFPRRLFEYCSMDHLWLLCTHCSLRQIHALPKPLIAMLRNDRGYSGLTLELASCGRRGVQCGRLHPFRAGVLIQVSIVGCPLSAVNLNSSIKFILNCKTRVYYKIQRSGFHSRDYQIFWEVVGLERGPLSLVSKIEGTRKKK
jgi:hypothetical protein